MATLTRRTPDQGYTVVVPTGSQSGSQNIANNGYAFSSSILANDLAYILSYPLSQIPQPPAMGTQEWYDATVASAYSSAGGFYAAYLGPQLSSLASKWDTSGKTAISGGNVNVTIDWDLANKQAETGTPQWARKILNDQVGNVPGSLADQFQQAFPTVQAKRDYFTGGNDFSVTGTTTDPILGQQFQAGVHIATQSSGRGDNPRPDGQWFDTLPENVSGYGIPVFRAGERLIDTEYDDEWTGTGAYVTPRYSLGAPNIQFATAPAAQAASNLYSQDYDSIKNSYNQLIQYGTANTATVGGWTYGKAATSATAASYNAPLRASGGTFSSKGNSWYW